MLRFLKGTLWIVLAIACGCARYTPAPNAQQIWGGTNTNVPPTGTPTPFDVENPAMLPPPDRQNDYPNRRQDFGRIGSAQQRANVNVPRTFNTPPFSNSRNGASRLFPNIARPNWRFPGTIQQQRSLALEHDPFVDNIMAPEIVGGRPREFSHPSGPNGTNSQNDFRPRRSPFGFSW